MFEARFDRVQFFFEEAEADMADAAYLFVVTITPQLDSFGADGDVVQAVDKENAIVILVHGQRDLLRLGVELGAVGESVLLTCVVGVG